MKTYMGNEGEYPPGYSYCDIPSEGLLVLHHPLFNDYGTHYGRVFHLVNRDEEITQLKPPYEGDWELMLFKAEIPHEEDCYCDVCRGIGDIYNQTRWK